MEIKTVKKIFNAHDGIMRTNELRKNKIFDKFLKRLITNGYVEKIKYGYYQWQDSYY